jgi:hypothetical protein
MACVGSAARPRRSLCTRIPPASMRAAFQHLSGLPRPVACGSADPTLIRPFPFVRCSHIRPGALRRHCMFCSTPLCALDADEEPRLAARAAFARFVMPGRGCALHRAAFAPCAVAVQAPGGCTRRALPPRVCLLATMFHTARARLVVCGLQARPFLEAKWLCCGVSHIGWHRRRYCSAVVGWCGTFHVCKGLSAGNGVVVVQVVYPGGTCGCCLPIIQLAGLVNVSSWQCSAHPTQCRSTNAQMFHLWLTCTLSLVLHSALFKARGSFRQRRRRLEHAVCMVSIQRCPLDKIFIVC